MRKLALALNLVLFLTGTCFADISITQERFDNLDVIHKSVKKSHPDFICFRGTKENLKVYGISDEQAIKTIGKIDLEKLKEDKEKKNKDDKKLNILDAIGLVESDIEKIKNLP